METMSLLGTITAMYLDDETGDVVTVIEWNEFDGELRLHKDKAWGQIGQEVMIEIYEPFKPEDEIVFKRWSATKGWEQSRTE